MQGCSSCCFCSIPLGGWGHLRGLCRLPGGRDWYLTTGGWSCVLSLWWAGLCVGSMFVKQLFTQEDFKQPIWWWVRLCSRPVFCLAWGIPALEPTGCWVGLGLGEEMVASRRAHVTEYSPELLPPVSLSPQWATAATHLQGDTPILAGKSGPVSYEVITFFLGSWCTQDSLKPPWVEFLYPSVMWNSCSQSPLAFKTRYSGGSSSQCHNSILGSLTWGWELSLLWENFCIITIFYFVGHPPDMYGIWFLSWLCPSFSLVVALSLFLYLGYLFC